MRMRPIVLGLFGMGVLAAPDPASTQQPDKNRQRAERVQTIRRQLTSLEAVGRDQVLRERGLRSPRRPAVNTASNVETFDPVKARYVRFHVRSTVDGNEPSLHTFHIEGPDSPANLAANPGIWARASSILPSFIPKFCGGEYAGPDWSWISNERGKGWLELELLETAKVNRIVWSRDAAGRHHDRIPLSYTIEVSEDGNTWRTVASDEGRALPGRDYTVLRTASVKALEAGLQRQHQELLDELRRLGAHRLEDIKSGPQVGENVNGAFAALFLNGDPRHCGKQRCPV